jgi:hypothetical protein
MGSVQLGFDLGHFLIRYHMPSAHWSVPSVQCQLSLLSCFFFLISMTRTRNLALSLFLCDCYCAGRLVRETEEFAST